MRRFSGCTPGMIAGWAALAGAAHASGTDAPLPAVVEFNRDIRPIFSDRCYACHGPDEKKRKGELRLDTQAGAFAERKDSVLLVAHQPAESELFRRVAHPDASQRMPPAENGPPLTERQVRLIGRWIEQGAQWQKHWSFMTPQRPEPPTVRNAAWPKDDLDRFILARLENAGLSPSPEAERTTLIRRVSLDLTGLPPTPAEVDAFLADASPDAYETVVDRLLATSQYGERMALHWLDLARYADTNGFHVDNAREMWRWRDWVIEAFNRNERFNQFTIEQIAGDLLPEATMEQKLASGFNRNHMTNFESGAVPEEYHNAYIVDRVNTTATVWMGLTVACAQCHDHKYDPITQKEYYQFYAFFNTIQDNGLDGRDGNSVPLIKAPLPLQTKKHTELRASLAAAEKTMADLEPKVVTTLAAWEPKRLAELPRPPEDGLVAHYELDNHTADTCGRYAHGTLRGGAAAYEPGKIGGSLKLDKKVYVDCGPTGDFERTDAFSYGGWIKATGETGGAALAKMDDAAAIRGYDLYISGGTVFVHLIHQWDKNVIRLNTKNPMPLDQWHHVLMTYDGSSKAAGIRIYVDGSNQELVVTHDSLTETIRTDKPLHLGRRNPGSEFSGWMDDIRIYRRYLTEAEAVNLAQKQPYRAILALPGDLRSKEQSAEVRADFLANGAPPEIKEPHDQLVRARKEEQEFAAAIPTVMVMQEMEKPRETFMLVRGAYDARGEKVAPGVPATLSPLPANTLPNRLGLARWLVEPSHPLTARVTVNQFWAMIFGAGLVRTPEDFGAQGEWPTHPELLDWLATEFVRTGWDVKAMLRLMVTSATYRQSSRVPPEFLDRDFENVLLARGPRFRLQAELIRDLALSVSGLLNTEIGGPSVLPYQPPGLWEEVAYGDNYTAQRYVQDHGPKLYRRGMYTYWKRSLPPASLSTFDAPDREVCTVRRPRTNTPLQALAMMNDVTYVEAARVLAQKMMREAGDTPEAKIVFAFRWATARTPNERELEILKAAYQRQRARFSNDLTAAMALATTGESPSPEDLDPIEHAAWTTVVNMILNLDETITKG